MESAPSAAAASTPTPTDPGLGQLLTEIQAEKDALAGDDKYFEQTELEALFDADPASPDEEPPAKP